MKFVLVFILFYIFYINSVFAQQKGIHFEQKLTWYQIKEKAKKENKYIFLDGYTTWCIPCKEMETKVFPNSDVASFFNENFINISVQFDETKNDNKLIKSWKKIADSIKNVYEITSYPTYLFFNPNGQLIHKILGATLDPKEFIQKAKSALNPAMQYSTLKAQFDKGKRDTSFLKLLINSAMSSDIKSLPLFINEYLPHLPDSIKKQNLILAYYGTTKTTDYGFKLLQKFPVQIDSIVGKGYSKKTIERLIFEKIAFPLLRLNGTITNHGGGMILYSGDVNVNVNWDDLEREVMISYPKYKVEVVRYSKLQYYMWSNDWAKYVEVVDNYTTDHQNIIAEELSEYARTIFQYCKSKVYLNKAIDWLKIDLKLTKVDEQKYKYITAELKYKLGDKEQAILDMEEILKISNPKNVFLADELKKMKNGDKTWLNN